MHQAKLLNGGCNKNEDGISVPHASSENDVETW